MVTRVMTRHDHGTMCYRVTVVVRLLSILVTFALGSGCSCRHESGSAAESDPVLDQVMRVYGSHLRMPPYRPPADEADFKKILAEAGDSILRRAGVRTVDELLVSPRDSQPFVIAYGKQAPALLDKGIVAHERTGVAGRRLVAYSLGYVSEVDEATFGSLLQGP